MSDHRDMKQNKTRGYFFPQGVCNPAGRKNTELTKTPTSNNRSKKKKKKCHINSMLKRQKRKSKPSFSLPMKKIITSKCFYTFQVILFKCVVL